MLVTLPRSDFVSSGLPTILDTHHQIQRRPQSIRPVLSQAAYCVTLDTPGFCHLHWG